MTKINDIGTVAREKKAGRIAIVVVFGFALWLPLIQMCFPLFPELESSEKRTLAPPPKIGKLRLRSFNRLRRDFEPYFNDHFGFRNYLVRADSLLTLNVFKISPTPNVVIGKDGWLYYNSKEGGCNLPDFFGRANFTTEQLETIGNYTTRIRREMDKRGIRFLIVLAPNKQSIYPNYLPGNVQIRKGKKTRADQLDELFAARGIDFVDLREPLLRAKKIYPYDLYYKTDTHWNELGAFVGYEAIMGEIKRTHPGISFFKPEDFSITQKENKQNTDLAGYIGMGGSMEDESIFMTPNAPVKAAFLSSGSLNIATEDFQSKIAQGGDPKAPKVLVFGDSFISAMLPFLIESFSRSVFLWQQKVDLDIVDKEKPDIVLFEFVERFSENAIMANQ